jgi:hypothetical protein
MGAQQAPQGLPIPHSTPDGQFHCMPAEDLDPAPSLLLSENHLKRQHPDRHLPLKGQQTWGGDPLECPCGKGTMKPVRKAKPHFPAIRPNATG